MSQTATPLQSQSSQAQQPVSVGLIGRGITRSRSPRMHLAAAEAIGLPYTYRVIDAADQALPQDAAGLLNLAEDQGLTGLNVTHPFKRDVLPLMDELSDAAERVGAINTVVFQGGKRFGHNTDHWGFGTSFERGLPDTRRERVLLLGAGGAGGAVAHALLDAGVGEVLVHDVEADVAAALVARLAAHHGGTRAKVAEDAEHTAATCDGIVNATPVGMAAYPGTPLPVESLRPDHWVADIIYVPLETALTKAARARGCAVLPGAGMALYQAVRAFEIFAGRKPDVARMQEAFDTFD